MTVSPDTGKRLLDLAIALPVSVIVVPLLGAVAVVNRIAGDRGPVLHHARRVGESGRLFTVFKLRTMAVDAPGGPLTSTDDPRITRVGRFLRDTKIDEVPQFWNVVLGQMSLVGPRPEDPAFVDWSDPVHRRVFRQRPGITGLAQLTVWDEGPLHDPVAPEASYRTQVLPAKLAIELRYAERRSLRVDAEILRATLFLFVRRAAMVGARYAGRR